VAIAILSDIEEVEAEVAKLRAAPRGHLHVNTSNGFAVHQLVPAVPDFLARYPDIQLELSVTDRVVDLVTEHADVVIRSGSIVDTTLTARKIVDYERTICASPAYLERRGTPRTPADLSNHTCVVFSIPTTRRWPFHTREGVAYADIAPRVITDSSETALRLALDGVGLARLGDVIVGEPIRRGLLVPVLTDVHYAEPVSLSALYLAGRHRLPKVRVFLDFLTERFAGAPWRISTSRGAA
jgi:DNA-binding transcriptional LysR family regulator